MRYTLTIMLALFIINGPRARAARAAETLQPNVIIILADDLGYATGMYGKWHLGYHSPLMPTRQGFDDYRGLVGGGGDHFSHIDRSGREDWWHNEEIEMETGYSAELINKHGVTFIEQHKDDPFFLYLPHQVIHFPWQGPGDQGYRTKGGSYWNDKHGRIEDKSNVSPYVKAMVEALDQSIGEIMATLHRLDLDRRAFVFFASDNGGYLRYGGGYENISSNGPLRGQKGDMYEGGHRVPAIAWRPGMIEPGTVTHETTATFDLFPTILHVAGQGDQLAKLNLDGRSIAPLLFENTPVPKRTLFWRMRGAKAVRRGPWKLVVRPGEETPQLYNLDEDVAEERDLAAERTDIVSQLETELSVWEGDVDNSTTAVASTSQSTTHASNSLGMKLVQIEPGSFTMGSADGEWDERPVHQVTLSRPFLMAITEVTNVQYEQFDPLRRKYRGTRGVSNEDDEAVVYVSWRDAVAFCKWLTEKEGKPYRLPTEAEWEYACRAGTTTTFHTGDVLPEAFHRNQPVEGDWATERFKKDGDLRAKKGKVPVSLRVETMPANAFGLHELHGNVEEWCGDWYGDYPTFPEIDPIGPVDGLFKVSRGGSHNTYARHLRSANRHSTVPEDKHWLIGFRVVQAPHLKAGARIQANNTMDDSTVSTARAAWDESIDEPVFIEPIPFVIPDNNHPHLTDLSHHHCPSITWCDNGDLVAAWFNTRSELGREMVTLTSRLRHGAKEWDKSRIIFAPADRNTTGVNLVNDGMGRLYFFNAIAESSHHRDQCLVMSTSENSGRTWTRPRIISDLDDRHKYTPMDAAFIARDGSLVVAMDYAPIGHSANECGSGVFMSPDRGQTWLDRVSGKVSPEIGQGRTDGLIAGFHPGIVQLNDDRLMAFARTGNIEKRMTKSVSGNMGKTWTYQRSEFPPIGGGQRLVLMRLSEGPILLVSFTDSRRRAGMTFADAEGREFTGYGMFAALSFDEGKIWPVKKLLTAGGPPREVDGGGNTHEFTMDDAHAEPAGYLASTQTPDGVIHLISSRWHYRFSLAWLKTP